MTGSLLLALNSGLCYMKRLIAVLFRVDGMLVPSLSGCPNNSPEPFIHVAKERHLRVKCLAQEHNTMSSAMARAQTSLSGVQRANYLATTPLAKNVITGKYFKD